MTERHYDVIAVEGGAVIKAWTRGVDVEEDAVAQLRRTARLPFIYKWIAVMPDVHLGMGATIGSVIPTRGAVVPAAVGVDIGCGMMAARTSLTASDLPEDLSRLRAAIERTVPHGRTNDGRPGDRGAWGQVPERHEALWRQQLAERYEAITGKRPRIGKGVALEHLGTLGTGNHFIEVSLDEEGRVWIVLHSGSRGVGNRIGTTFVREAREAMDRWFIDLDEPMLAYLPRGTEAFRDYLEAAGWAQDYAALNRDLMLEGVLSALDGCSELPSFEGRLEVVRCHHNYVAWEEHYGESVLVTRKGAVRARAGELGIIPGSMGARSYIVEGLGNAESFCSCSHGAGRRMSRSAARRQFTVEDHRAATAGIECRKDETVLDETPAAYKPIDAVMEAQRDLVRPVHELRQVLCVKG